MNLRTPLALAALAGGLAITAAPALGHDSTLSCSPTGGPPVASADARYGTPTITENPDGSFTLTWPDGYTRVKAAPTGCGPTPPPTPTPPEVVPPGPAAPPTCADLARLYPFAGKARRIAWGCATPAPPVPPTRTKVERRTVFVHACAKSGDRAYRVDRIRTTKTRDGEVVGRWVRLVRVNGPICRTPAVTG